MDYRFLLITVIILLLIGTMWFISSNYYTDSIKVNITDTDSKLLDDWFKYELNVENNTDENLIEQSQLAGINLLKTLYDINPDTIIVGSKVNEAYHQLTGKYLVPNRTLFDLRDILGISLQIGIVNSRLYNKLSKDQDYESNKHQLKLLIAIVEHKAYDLLLPYISKVLNHRWNKLQELQDERIINNNGSYLYLRSDNEEILPNITGALISNNEVRINLLCSEYEFDLLLKRWRTYIKAH